MKQILHCFVALKLVPAAAKYCDRTMMIEKQSVVKSEWPQKVQLQSED